MSSGGPLGSKGAASGRGTTVSTKGMISQFTSPTAPAPGIKGDPLVLSILRPPIQIVIPTAINTVLMTVENINQNLRVQQTSNFTTVSLYKRAHLVAYETDEIALVRP